MDWLISVLFSSGCILFVPDTMKKANKKELSDELRSEYDFSKLKGGVRGKYAKRFQKGTNLVLLSPDVAENFPEEQAVNDALRFLLQQQNTISE